MLSLSSNSFFQLLQFVVGLMSPEVLQALGGWARAGGGSALPSPKGGRSQHWARTLAVHTKLCFGSAFLLSPLPYSGSYTCNSPQGVQSWLVVEVAHLCALQSWGVRALQVSVRLPVPGVPLVDQLAEQRIWGKRRGWVRRPWHRMQAVGIQLRGWVWWRGGLSGNKPDYMGSGRGSRFTLNLLSVQKNPFMGGQMV